MNKSLKNFTSIIETIQTQLNSDNDYAKNLGEALGVEINPYNNSLLVNLLVDVIGSWFENKTDVISKVNHFMYDMNFGRLNGKSLVTIEDTWIWINKK